MGRPRCARRLASDKPFAISEPVFTAAGLETFIEASAVVAGNGAGAPIVGYLSNSAPALPASWAQRARRRRAASLRRLWTGRSPA